MIIENLIKKFWLGKLKLWQSFWLIGGIGGIIIGQIIIFIENIFFSNNSLNPTDLSFRGKILVLGWLIYCTVGIWRSAENYQGSKFWQITTKIYLATNCLSTIYLLYFFKFSSIY